MELTESLNTYKLMVVFLKILDEETFDLFSPNHSVIQVSFTHCYQQEDIKLTLFKQRIQNKVVIFDNLLPGEYFFNDLESKQENLFLSFARGLIIKVTGSVVRYGETVVELLLNDEYVNNGEYDAVLFVVIKQ